MDSVSPADRQLPRHGSSRRIQRSPRTVAQQLFSVTQLLCCAALLFLCHVPSSSLTPGRVSRVLVGLSGHFAFAEGFCLQSRQGR